MGDSNCHVETNCMEAKIEVVSSIQGNQYSCSRDDWILNVLKGSWILNVLKIEPMRLANRLNARRKRVVSRMTPRHFV